MDDLTSGSSFVWKWLRSPAIGSWKPTFEVPLLHALTAIVGSASGDQPVWLDIHPFVDRRAILERLPGSSVVLRRSRATEPLSRLRARLGRGRSPVPASVVVRTTPGELGRYLAAPALWDASFVIYGGAVDPAELPDPHNESMRDFAGAVDWSISRTLIGLDCLVTAKRSETLATMVQTTRASFASQELPLELLDLASPRQLAIGSRVVDL